MNEHEAYQVILKQLCKECCQIAEQIQKNQTMSQQDLDRLDKIYHLKKSMRTDKAMSEAEEYADEYGMSGTDGNNQNGNSGYRGRAANGRYVSRMSGDAYSDGYNRGYSEAMNEQGGNSGHYPMMPYAPRRW